MKYFLEVVMILDCYIRTLAQLWVKTVKNASLSGFEATKCLKKCLRLTRSRFSRPQRFGNLHFGLAKFDGDAARRSPVGDDAASPTIRLLINRHENNTRGVTFVAKILFGSIVLAVSRRSDPARIDRAAAPHRSPHLGGF
ncbi:hypothetical protein GEV33_000037 [Tenebrio molitor]|uniref:Uncharacterized protein n=1 Tax=Tenebrio molitor TaxID=7067 RepID=A0A8J6HXX4_TENMO|nr:hypothetical protein GEV33_000037 [Tenebrio molitor]